MKEDCGKRREESPEFLFILIVVQEPGGYLEFLDIAFPGFFYADRARDKGEQPALRNLVGTGGLGIILDGREVSTVTIEDKDQEPTGPHILSLNITYAERIKDFRLFIGKGIQGDPEFVSQNRSFVQAPSSSGKNQTSGKTPTQTHCRQPLIPVS
jgi:hypothetical protein